MSETKQKTSFFSKVLGKNSLNADLIPIMRKEIKSLEQQMYEASKNLRKLKNSRDTDQSNANAIQRDINILTERAKDAFQERGPESEYLKRLCKRVDSLRSEKEVYVYNVAVYNENIEILEDYISECENNIQKYKREIQSTQALKEAMKVKESGIGSNEIKLDVLHQSMANKNQKIDEYRVDAEVTKSMHLLSDETDLKKRLLSASSTDTDSDTLSSLKKEVETHGKFLPSPSSVNKGEEPEQKSNTDNHVGSWNNFIFGTPNQSREDDGDEENSSWIFRKN